MAFRLAEPRMGDEGGLHGLIRESYMVLAGAAARRYWSIGFSGGKDSSVLLDLVLRFLEEGCPGAASCPERVVIVYADTLLEPLVLRRYALGVVEAVNKVAAEKGLPVEAHSASPGETGETLVEMVIGRGYPAPSSRFRWCTDRWKIRPTRILLRKLLGGWGRDELAVITGVRAEEAAHRAARGSCGCGLRVDDVGGSAYAPLQSWDAQRIWRYIFSRNPAWRDPSWRALVRIYGGPAAGLRMGCWACTLIARDRGWESLVSRGLVNSETYALLDAWRRAWLHMSRRRPDLWRVQRSISGRRRWRYSYSKLLPEARLVLALLLNHIASLSSEAGEMLSPMLPSLRRHIRSLIDYAEAAAKKIAVDRELAKLLTRTGLALGDGESLKKALEDSRSC